MPVFKLALPGYRADTDTNPDHFSVYYDSTDPNSPVLIKEKLRGSSTITSGSSVTIAHGLSYIPMVIVFLSSDANTWVQLRGDSGYIGGFIEVNSTNLIIHNTGAVTQTAKYYIFYDKVVWVNQ